MLKKSDTELSAEERAARLRWVRFRLHLLRVLRCGMLLLLWSVSLLLLLIMLAGPAWEPTLPFLYDWLPLRPLHALYALFRPEITVDGELGYDILWGDVLLFYGVLLIVPWCILCSRYKWLPVSLLLWVLLWWLLF